MATKERSQHIRFQDEEKLKLVNPETLKLWKKYQVDMSLRELSEKTQEAYYSDLRQFWIYLLDNHDNISVTEVDEDTLTEFFYFCKSGGNNSRRMKRRMSSLSAFYKFLRKKRIISESPMEFIDRPKKDNDVVVQTYFTEEMVENIKTTLRKNFEDSQTIKQKHLALEYLVYSMFSLSTMARVNAVSSIGWYQIDFEARTVENVIEKEGYIVTLYFSPEVKDLLQELLDFRREHGIDDKGYVFISAYGVKKSKADPAVLCSWCKSIGEMIDVPSLHPHDFRHSGANLLKNAGMPLEDISALLQHKGTDVTVKHYLKVDKTKIQQNKDKFGI